MFFYGFSAMSIINSCSCAGCLLADLASRNNAKLVPNWPHSWFVHLTSCGFHGKTHSFGCFLLRFIKKNLESWIHYSKGRCHFPYLINDTNIRVSWRMESTGWGNRDFSPGFRGRLEVTSWPSFFVSVDLRILYQIFQQNMTASWTMMRPDLMSSGGW